MRLVKGYIATDKVGSTCEFELEVEDDASADDIEAEAKDTAFNHVSWGYTVGEPGSGDD